MNESKIEWQVGYYDKPADERLSREDCTVEIDLFDPTESDLERDRCKAAIARVFELVDAGKHDITITKMDDTAAVESFRWSPEICHVVADLDDDDPVMRLKSLGDESDGVETFFKQLDALQDSGEINMWGAPAWLVENFEISKPEAKRIFALWCKHKEDEYEWYDLKPRHYC